MKTNKELKEQMNKLSSDMMKADTDFQNFIDENFEDKICKCSNQHTIEFIRQDNRDDYFYVDKVCKNCGGKITGRDNDGR